MFSTRFRVISAFLLKHTSNAKNFSNSDFNGSRSGQELLIKLRNMLRHPVSVGSGLVITSLVSGYGLSLSVDGPAFDRQKNLLHHIDTENDATVSCSPMDGNILHPPPQPPPYQPPLLPLRNHGVARGPRIRLSRNDTPQQRRLKMNQIIGQRQHDFIYTHTIQAADPQDFLANGDIFFAARSRTWQEWRNIFGNLLGRDEYGQANFKEVHVVLWDCETNMPDWELWETASMLNPEWKWFPYKLPVVSGFWNEDLGEYRFHVYQAFVLFEFEREYQTYSDPNLFFDNDVLLDFTTPSRIVSIYQLKEPVNAPPGDFEVDAIVKNFDNIMAKWNRDTTFIR